MKNLIRLLLWLVALPVFLIFLLYLTGNQHILYGLQGTYLIGKSRPDIDDMSIFHLRELKAGKHEPWAEKLNPNGLSAADLTYLDSLQSEAFLVIYKDTIRCEWYGENYDQDTPSNSFSMAKSFTSMAIGLAADQGILNPDDLVYTYLPRFNEGQSQKLTIKHLLQMRSNIDFGESYSNPFGYQAKAYYGRDLWEITEPFRVGSEPGTLWKYEGGNTVLLAEILKTKTGKNVSQWFEEGVWSKIGAKHSAYWNLDDENGEEKAFSGFYATARDFARIGKLMLQQGEWNGEQLLSKSWCFQSVYPHFVEDIEGNQVKNYGWQWWMAEPEEKPWHFQARGMRGQYIVVVPEKELVVVRLGHERDEGEKVRGLSPDLIRWVEIGLTFAN